MTSAVDEVRRLRRLHWAAYSALIVFTFVTGGAALGYGVTGGVVTAFGIAAIQAALIGAFLMHVKREGKAVATVLLFTVFVVVSLLGLVAVSFRDTASGTVRLDGAVEAKVSGKAVE